MLKFGDRQDTWAQAGKVLQLQPLSCSLDGAGMRRGAVGSVGAQMTKSSGEVKQRPQRDEDVLHRHRNADPCMRTKLALNLDDS